MSVAETPTPRTSARARIFDPAPEEHGPVPAAGEAAPETGDVPSASPSGPETVEERLARRRAVGRRWRARIGFVVILALCIGVGIRQADQRIERSRRIAFDEVTLVGDPIDLVTTAPASVVSIAVRPGEQVAAGAVVATLDVIRPAPAGGEQRVRSTLTAPVDGVVASVPTNEGAALLAGGIVVRLYEPAALHFEIEVALDRTVELELGQRGLFRADGVDPVAATLVSIEPSLRPGRDGEPMAVMELTPDDPSAVEGLLIGLPFRGWLAKAVTAPAGAEPTGS